MPTNDPTKRRAIYKTMRVYSVRPTVRSRRKSLTSWGSSFPASLLSSLPMARSTLVTRRLSAAPMSS